MGGRPQVCALEEELMRAEGALSLGLRGPGAEPRQQAWSQGGRGKGELRVAPLNSASVQNPPYL